MTDQSVITPLLWLQEAGFDAYLVGNQVRDRLLGGVSDRGDVDVATNAHPDEVVGVLRRNNITPGFVDEKFGVVSFVYDNSRFEATTLRQDIYHSDFVNIKRYPDEIRFVKLLAQDAQRRDFTINAIYYNPKTKRYLDYVGGMEDMKNRRIRVIGDGEIRFQEDPLRILRAVRLKHLLDFAYDPPTWEQMRLQAGSIKKLSPGILKKELQKIQELDRYVLAKEDLKKLGLIQIV